MKRLWIALMVMTLVAGACSSSSSDRTDTTAPPAATTAPATTAAPSTSTAPASGAASSAEEARAAVVQIIAEGSFVDPFEGIQANVPGTGSGFIIDESGLAVTNNHVVTGAGLLRVYVGDEERNARVVAVSECSDLAVIDIEGEDFTYLEWYGDPITAGLEIYAAGFPLGDTEYTLLDGIVSKEDAAGETTWASVDAVIEHSADTLPGNSGGPIMTPEGKVVGVNYAGNDVGQSFAIGRDVARSLVDRLAAGESINTVGINGEAFLGAEFAGIWVFSVQSGSPADLAGIQPGDLLLSLEGLDLALDGTMSDYCDILRSHSATDVLTVEVYRSTTDEILEGQLNGRILEPTFTFAGELEGLTQEPPAAGGLPPYADFVLVSDDSGAITVSVPVEWFDSLGIPWEFDGQIVGPALTAAPDADLWQTTWGTPGVFIAASDQLPVSRLQLLDQTTFFESCDYVDRFDYDDGLYVGDFDFWENCGAEGSEFIVVAAEPIGGGFTILAQIIIVDERDFEAADEVFATFLVGGDLGAGVAAPPAAAPPAAAPPAAGGVELASGLLCRDLAEMGFGYYEAVGYWIREGHPARMDADLNGIPCETVFSLAEVDGFYSSVVLESDGLFCRDFFDFGSFYSEAVAYWILWGFPDRMDADLNGIPCETVYPYEEYDPFLYFEYYIG